MIKIILITLITLIVLPAYLFTGREIIDFIYTNGSRYTNYDFKKKPWKIFRIFFIITWLPTMYVIFCFGLFGYFIYRGIKFYSGAKVDAAEAWKELKFKFRYND